MSISFYGVKKDPTAKYGQTPVPLYYSDGEERYLNLSNVNARAFLQFLGLPGSEDDIYGSADFPTVRRAIMKARALFDRKVDQYVRADETGTGAGGCRVIAGGIDRDYFARRLDALSSFVEDLAREGADTLSWG